jgi:hypothetical protein
MATSRFRFGTGTLDVLGELHQPDQPKRLSQAERELPRFQRRYSEQWPHSSLGDRTVHEAYKKQIHASLA